MWTDLHAPGPGRPAFPNAHYYWKVGQDPAVQAKPFGDDWRRVDYVITTPQLLQDTAQNGFSIVVPALEHSLSVARFDSGWPVDIRRGDPRIAPQFHFVQSRRAAPPSCMASTV